MVKKGYLLLLFLLISFSGISQNIISYISVNPETVYIGQPVQLKVSVYTTTWFTKGIDLGNIQVDGALTVYFRSLSNTRTISGKKYAGVDFFYNLFPTEAGVITIPALEIYVESPKEGDFKGIKRFVKTIPKSVTVNSIPLGYDPNNWLVASSLNVSDKWSKKLNNIKVGDVIQRTISRSAAGTLSEFIPATIWDSISGISVYPNRPQVKTHKSKTGVSALRSESVNYLFEKEGEVIIPAIEYLYWNSSNKKFYKKKIDSITINVKPNANLAMLESIKKSLQKESVEEIKEKEFLIFGLTPKEFISYFILVILGSYLLFYFLKNIRSIYITKEAMYLQSEYYAFKQVTKAIQKNDFNTFVKTVNTWLIKLNDKPISLDEFVLLFGTSELKKILFKLNEILFKHQSSCKNSSFNVLHKQLKLARKNYLKQKKNNKKLKNDRYWLNPTVTD